MDWFWQMQIPWTLWAQSLGEWLAQPMLFFSSLGTELAFMAIMPLIFWCVDSRLGIRIAAMMLFSNTVNSTFKYAFQHPRPYWFDTSVHAYSTEPSFGLPSGHAQMSLSTWGLLAAGVKNRWQWIVGAVIFFIGLSRIYLGVHFTTDVLVGWLIGGLLLWLFIRFDQPVSRWLENLSTNRQVAVVLISTILVVCIPLVVLSSVSRNPIPDQWVANALAANPATPIAPYDPSGIFTVGGTWLGSGLGIIFLRRRGGFSNVENIKQFFGRYLIGMGGIVVLYLGLGAVFPRSEDFISYALRVFRYTLIGFWVTGFAPFVFLRFKFARTIHG